MKYFLIVGEASGDLHGASLMRELKNTDPEAEFCFLGGDLMQNEGGRLVQHYKNMAFMGIVNVILNLNKIAKNFELCTKAIKEFNPDVVILIDYPGFNLKIAKHVKKTSQIPVYYYIAPKLWAWKEYRIKTIKRYVDRMFVIFPFETEYFAKLGYKVDYVGNPTAETIDRFLTANAERTNSPSLPTPTTKPMIALLCGSRRQEVGKCLPVMAKMATYFPQYQFVAAAAPNIDKDFYDNILHSGIEIVYNDTYNILRQSKAAIVNSGTATLETALIGTPQVVVYHVIGGILVPLLRKMLIKIPFVSLVNLIAQKEAVKELITPKFNEKNLRYEFEKILTDKKCIEQVEQDYAEIRKRLGNESASKNTASMIYKLLKKNKVNKG